MRRFSGLVLLSSSLFLSRLLLSGLLFSSLPLSGLLCSSFRLLSHLLCSGLLLSRLLALTLERSLGFLELGVQVGLGLFAGFLLGLEVLESAFEEGFLL